MSTPLRKCYIIIFDVATKGALDALKEKLKQYGYYCPLVQDKSWAILSEDTAAQIRDNLTLALGSADRLYVLRSGGEGAWRNSYGEKNNDWLKKYL
jgi:hypothetical protein